MVTCVHRGSTGGGGWWMNWGALPGEVVVVEDRGPAGQDGGHRGGGRRVEGQGAQVLDHHQVGVVEGGVQLRPGRRGPRPPWPSPASRRSTGPAPATVKVVKPSEARACCHLAASTATPSVPPRRNESEGGGRDGRHGSGAAAALRPAPSGPEGTSGGRATVVRCPKTPTPVASPDPMGAELLAERDGPSSR